MLKVERRCKMHVAYNKSHYKDLQSLSVLFNTCIL